MSGDRTHNFCPVVSGRVRSSGGRINTGPDTGHAFFATCPVTGQTRTHTYKVCPGVRPDVLTCLKWLYKIGIFELKYAEQLIGRRGGILELKRRGRRPIQDLSKKKKPVNIVLLDEVKDMALKLGEGNVSLGIEKAVRELYAKQ